MDLRTGKISEIVDPDARGMALLAAADADDWRLIGEIDPTTGRARVDYSLARRCSCEEPVLEREARGWLLAPLGPAPRVYPPRRTRKIRPPADDSRRPGAEHEGPDERNLDALQPEVTTCAVRRDSRLRRHRCRAGRDGTPPMPPSPPPSLHPPAQRRGPRCRQQRWAQRRRRPRLAL